VLSRDEVFDELGIGPANWASARRGGCARRLPHERLPHLFSRT